MSKKNYTIRQFDPKIYPRLLWVSVGAPIEALREMFGENFPDIDEYAIADTCRVKVEKPKERAGLLIRFRSKNDITLRMSLTKRATRRLRYSITASVRLPQTTKSRSPIYLGGLQSVVDL